MPTNEELANQVFRNFINKVCSEVVLPPRNTKVGKAEYEQMMDKINSKVNDYYVSIGRDPYYA